MVKLLLSVLSTLALSLVAYVEAAPTAGLQHVAPKVVALDFEVHHKSANATLSKRGINNVPLENEGIYVVNLLFGSQKEPVGVRLDTGSSDLWVPSPAAGSPFGSFNITNSTTAKYLNLPFHIEYGEPGSFVHVTGEYYTDTVSFSDGSFPLQNFQFASVDSYSGFVSGILGVGYTSLESTYTAYPNLPQAIKDQGYVDKNAYSLFLNSPDAATGSILFGGKDIAKIDGDLVVLPPAGGYQRLETVLNEVSFNGKSISVGWPTRLDTGSSAIVFDQDTFTQVTTEFFDWDGVTTYLGFPVVTSIPSGNIAFQLQGITIEVPISDIAFNAGNGKFGLSLQAGDLPLFGIPFLNNAYVVFDLEDHVISIGKVKFTDDSNIVPL